MRFLYLFISIIFLVACNNTRQSADLSLQEPDALLRAKMYQSEIIMSSPLSLDLLKGHLYAFQSTGENAAFVIDTKSGVVTKSWGKRGSGPGEFMYPIYWGKSGETVYLYDLNRFCLRSYQFEGTEMKLKKEINMAKKYSFRYATALENGHIIASVVYGSNEPLMLLDKNLEPLASFGSIMGADKESENQLSYSSSLASYKNKFVTAMSALGYVACYEQKGDSVYKLWEHYMDSPEYKNGALDKRQLKRGFTGVKMNDKYIYCAYSGKQWDNSMDVVPETLLVFNHQGKLIKHFQLDREIGQFEISEDGKMIYAIAFEPEINIVRYELSL